ncbi:MAG TPA: M20/M25/M40 family metallo-hydrolase [Thermoanaerobaculia bacterium]|nr:M20/M25/M40 family metallo-hydrolase [Thermoanaerobaculia bacterium]
MRRLASSAVLVFLWSQAAGAASGLSEPATWLRDYLRIDTSNPPGNEARAAGALDGLLTRLGIEHRRFASPAGRQSLWARLPATGAGATSARAILLLHHIDVVPPGPGWTVPPFGGLVRNGRLWGRGALDDKSLGIAQLAALVDLKRRVLDRRREIIWLAVADEESGGAAGTAWLLDEHPELFKNVEAVFGEGGANRVAQGRILWWGLEVAQKRPLWMEVAARGRGGHGSGLNPGSANHELIRGLARLLDAKPRWRVTAATRDYLRALAPLHNGFWRSRFLRIDAIVRPDGPTEMLMPGLANLFLDTVQVTVLSGGQRINVIPAQATAELDVRLLPDTDAAAFSSQIRRALGPDLATKVLVTAPPSAPSPVDTPVYRAAARVLGTSAPVVPAFIAGFTDSRYFRERGIPAYGLSPFALEGPDLAGIHSPDERIPLAEFDRGVLRMKKILAALVAP